MKTLSVPESVAAPLRDFINKEGIDLQISSQEHGHVCVRPDEDGERSKCGSETLYENGWITCTNARELAHRLNIEMKDAGRLLDFLNIKIRDCELGCF